MVVTLQMRLRQCQKFVECTNQIIAEKENSLFKISESKPCDRNSEDLVSL
jgi:hypothetical protein